MSGVVFSLHRHWWPRSGCSPRVCAAQSIERPLAPCRYCHLARVLLVCSVHSVPGSVRFSRRLPLLFQWPSFFLSPCCLMPALARMPPKRPPHLLCASEAILSVTPFCLFLVCLLRLSLRLCPLLAASLDSYDAARSLLSTYHCSFASKSHCCCCSVFRPVRSAHACFLKAHASTERKPNSYQSFCCLFVVFFSVSLRPLV